MAWPIQGWLHYWRLYQRQRNKEARRRSEQRRRKHTFDDLFAELWKSPEFRKEYQRQKPYYDQLVQTIRSETAQ